ncbi:MAG: pyridoxamine 5'-phosphate oxidase family protein [Candidatus Bathyarchaeota archaeon]|nr:pyridoxamine 5'-phosphate oxidase family protein [Candidatus Bathyarchaeota archaeon]MDH5787558.1 pyridoxamine 5'-phosphate oxidase family protein [Candidatus Bathyarchaeota archaeon]
MNGKSKHFRAEIWRHLKDFQHVFLATTENGQPRVRPVTLVNFDEKFWVLTGTENAKVKQIMKNPKIEFCLLLEEGEKRGYIRGVGYAKIVAEKETKIKVAKYCDFFNEFWENPDDPSYTLLELEMNEIEYLKPNETKTRKLKL